MQENQTQIECTLNADLHCHSTFSDGVLAPESLALRAKSNGVDLWALTDHDSLSGIPEAMLASKKLGLPFLPGVEISTHFKGVSIHVVGLGVDVDCALLQQGLDKIRTGRYERAQKIAAALERLQISDVFKGVLSYALNPELISRAHFSRFLVAQGICKNQSEAFNRYLSRGKPAYVEHDWVDLDECMSWIHAANGVAVLAHPGRYTELSKNQRRQLLLEFCHLEGKAIEVVTSSHSNDEMLQYAQIAQHYGLMGSRGSDFHSPDESRVDLGRLPLLPLTVLPVWQHLKNRIAN